CILIWWARKSARPARKCGAPNAAAAINPKIPTHPRPLIMKPSKTDYRGGAALNLATKALSLVVTTDVGPRVVALNSKRGKAGNLFLEIAPEDEKHPEFQLRGGHRLWHAPEHIVRTYQPDNDP